MGWGDLKGRAAETGTGLNRHSLEEAARRLENASWAVGMTRLELIDVIEQVVVTYSHAHATTPHS